MFTLLLLCSSKILFLLFIYRSQSRTLAGQIFEWWLRSSEIMRTNFLSHFLSLLSLFALHPPSRCHWLLCLSSIWVTLIWSQVMMLMDHRPSEPAQTEQTASLKLWQQIDSPRFSLWVFLSVWYFHRSRREMLRFWRGGRDGIDIKQED